MISLPVTRAAVAVIEEGRKHRWAQGRPGRRPDGLYEVYFQEPMARLLIDQANRTGKTPSELLLAAYRNGPGPDLDLAFGVANVSV